MSAEIVPPRLMKQSAAAAYIGKSVRQLQRKVEQGEIAPVYLDSKPSYLVADLDALIDNAPRSRPDDDA